MAPTMGSVSFALTREIYRSKHMHLTFKLPLNARWSWLKGLQEGEVLGSSWDLVTIDSWACDPTYGPPSHYAALHGLPEHY